MRTIYSLPIKEDAHIGAARRGVHAFADSFGFTGQALAEIDIVVQELGTNAVRYATDGGTLHWALTDEFHCADSFDGVLSTNRVTPFHRAHVPQEARCGIEIFYWDKGPGIPDIMHAARDGVSSGGGLGTGLGAIKRFMDDFDAYSSVPTVARPKSSGSRRTTHGTVVLCRKWLPRGARVAASGPAAATEHNRLRPGTTATDAEERFRRRIGTWSCPCAGETLNGDGYFVREESAQEGGRTLVAVVDGLGHGAGASEASTIALEVLDEWAGEPLDELMRATHEALRATRGAVMSVSLIDPIAARLHFAGVGNIQTRVFGAPEPVHPIPTNGTLGARLVKIPVWTHTWAEGTTLVMTSDGLSATWDINSYPGLLGRSPQVMAGVLMRDYARDSDDATVIVVR